MALGVFGDVGQKYAERSFQALAADVARRVEVCGRFRELGRGGVGLLEFVEEDFLGCTGFGFGFEECELFRSEGLFAGVG